MRLVRGGEDSYLELKVKLSNTEKIAQEIVALANTDGGVIIFGVNDQLRVEGVDDSEAVQAELVRICREEISPPMFPLIDRIAFDNGRRIVALDVDSRKRPYRVRDGRYYIRIGSEKREATREELSALIDEVRPLRLENVTAPGSTIFDVDEAVLWSFVRGFEGDIFENPSPTGYPTSDILERDLMLATKMGDEIIPTVAGILLFGKDDRVPSLLPRSILSVRRYAGDTIQSAEVEKIVLSGNLYSIFESSIRFIRRYCDLWDARPRNGTSTEIDPAAIPRANFHRGAVHEAVTNLLMHRDLSLRDVPSRINIFDHSIEFINPRRSSGFVPAAARAIRYGIRQQLNPQFASIFSSSAYGLDLFSGGLPNLFRESRLFSGRRAELHAFNDEFRLKIHGV
jgi:ATP-dependent DNA helicase RecG